MEDNNGIATVYHVYQLFWMVGTGYYYTENVNGLGGAITSSSSTTVNVSSGTFNLSSDRKTLTVTLVANSDFTMHIGIGYLV